MATFTPQTSVSRTTATSIPAIGRRLRVGVVGCGYWGSKHIRILSSLPDVEEVTIVDTKRAMREKIKAAFPVLRAFPNLEAALQHVDAFIVATPPRTHFDVAIRCLRSGKHVLLEKPMARSQAEARALIDEASRSNLTLMIGHTFEFNPAVRELKRRITLGELGNVYYLHSARLNLGLYRQDVNVIWDLAPHDISIMNYLLGAFPSAVAAWGSTSPRSGTEDLAYIRMQYEDLGVTGYARLSWLDPHKVREVVVVGSKKMAVYNDLVEERLRIFDRGVEPCEQQATPSERPLTYRYGDIVSPYIEFEEPLLLEVKHFVSSVQNGTLPQTDGHCGLFVVAVLEAIDKAIATGRVVRIRCPAALDPSKIKAANGYFCGSASP